jgi:hypothetical protein
MIQLLIQMPWQSRAYIDIKNNYFSSADRIFAHVQKENITLQGR